MIKPTVGRVVWYRPAPGEQIAYWSGSPLAAIVCDVHSDTLVNLMVIDTNGNPFGKTSVQLIFDGGPPAQGAYCEWMPYQKGQAAKTEVLEKAVGQ